jgi:hypothetical protein
LLNSVHIFLSHPFLTKFEQRAEILQLRVIELEVTT